MSVAMEEKPLVRSNPSHQWHFNTRIGLRKFVEGPQSCKSFCLRSAREENRHFAWAVLKNVGDILSTGAFEEIIVTMCRRNIPKTVPTQKGTNRAVGHIGDGKKRKKVSARFEAGSQERRNVLSHAIEERQMVVP